MRLLFWIALIVLIGFAVRSKLRALAAKAARDESGPARQGLVEGEAMACCAHCHVYFPASEAVQADGLAYCSQAHVRLPAQ